MMASTSTIVHNMNSGYPFSYQLKRALGGNRTRPETPYQGGVHNQWTSNADGGSWEMPLRAEAELATGLSTQEPWCLCQESNPVRGA